MQEQEWFMTLLSPKDMKAIGKYIPGFPTDTRNPKTLYEGINSALSRGYVRQRTRRRAKLPSIHIRELYLLVGNEFLSKNTSFQGENLNSFIIKLQADHDTPAFKKVSVLYVAFEDLYDTKLLPQMISNSENEQDLLKGLLEESEDLDTLSKIHILINENFDPFETTSVA